MSVSAYRCDNLTEHAIGTSIIDAGVSTFAKSLLAILTTLLALLVAGPRKDRTTHTES